MTTLSPAPDAADDRRALRNVAVLVASQALLGAQIPMVIVVAGLSGQALASNPCWATLPVSLMVLGSMLTATPLAALMQRRGRLAGFLVGTCGGALGGAIGAAGLYLGSFPVFLAGAFATGIYMSAQGFYRFAATDTASPSLRPKAISWVMAGGLLSAIVGPQLVKVTAEALAIPFLGTYLAVVVLNLAGAPLFAFLDIPRPAPAATAAPRGRSRRELIRSPTIAVAIVCATVAYALMNLVMTSSPLAIVGCGYMTADAANVVTAHVLAMFAPSFVTGHLISRFGTARIIGAGLVVLAAAGAVALAGVTLGHFYATLILLGIGWNFGFIGATTLLAGAHTPEERGRLQGLNDLVVFGGVTFASFASGGLMNCLGGSVQAGWSAVNLAMLPFLVLAGGALIWLGLRPRRA